MSVKAGRIKTRVGSDSALFTSNVSHCSPEVLRTDIFRFGLKSTGIVGSNLRTNSGWRCLMLVSAVQPVMILSAVFCVVWILFRLVSEMIGDQRVFPYSMTGRVIALYVVMSVSFCLPDAVEVSAFFYYFR